jgi:lipopolysaccharide transport system ATP-binding protein
VGDEHFARKSMAKMNEFKQRGKTIVLVTHDLGTVERWCDLAVWIDAGRVRDLGDPRAVVGHYRRVLAEEEAARVGDAPAPKPSLAPHPKHGPAPELGKRWGNFDLELTSVALAAQDGDGGTLSPESGLVIDLGFERVRELGPVRFHAALLRDDGLELWRTELAAAAVPQRGKLRLELDALPLGDGAYRLEVGARLETGEVLDCQRDLHGFSVRGARAGHGLLRIGHRWSGLAHGVARTEFEGRVA